jgi:hypothetical protein
MNQAWRQVLLSAALLALAISLFFLLFGPGS